MSIGFRGIFPLEILEKIFFYLDGKSLLKYRSVSSVWRKTIDDFMRRFDSEKWKWLFFETISRNILVEYLEVDVPMCLKQKIVNRNSISLLLHQIHSYKNLVMNFELALNSIRWNWTKLNLNSKTTTGSLIMKCAKVKA